MSEYFFKCAGNYSGPHPIPSPAININSFKIASAGEGELFDILLIFVIFSRLLNLMILVPLSRTFKSY